MSSESEVSVFFSLNENEVAVAAAELSAGAVLALADVKLTVSSESELSVFFSLNENDVAVAAAELSAGEVLALANVKLTVSSESEVSLAGAVRALADAKVVRVEMPMDPARGLGE